MFYYPVCRHCDKELGSRAGRGLCRSCWNDKTVREKYPLVATFGGNVRVQIKVREEYERSEDSKR